MSDNNVPMDMWREILIRLPTESLVRTRAVCKGWRSVFDDRPFVRAHQQQHNKNKIIMIRNSNSSYSFDLEALSFSNAGQQQTIPATPLDGSPELQWSYGVSACNGLILTEKASEIWNPLTHERLVLPPPRDFEFSSVMAFGLGYDYVTDDYKAVVILSTSRQTHVYSLKSDLWTRINMNCPQGPTGPGVFVCGALNWLSLGEEGVYDDKIVALDLGTEKYMPIQMPHAMFGSKYPGMSLNLDVLEGCLILCASGFSSHLDVWVMKDYGDEGSWTKLLSLDSRWGGFLRPVAFIRKEEEKRLQVFLQNDCFSFFLFDVDTNSIKSVFIKGHYREFHAQQMFTGTDRFCLHANCGGARRKIATSSTESKRSTSSHANLKQLVFCINWNDDDDPHESHDSCNGSYDHSGTKLEETNCSHNSR